MHKHECASEAIDRTAHQGRDAATAENVAPFGMLLGRRSGVKPTGLDYYAGAVAMSRPVNYQCTSQTELSLTTLKRRPFQVKYLERHFQHTQTFIPLGGKAYVAVLAPPCKEDMPDFSAVRALRFEGDTGLCLHIGTWHEFPFALEDDTDLAVALSSQVDRSICTIAPRTASKPSARTSTRKT
jgi:ureidoglycolate lyase